MTDYVSVCATCVPYGSGLSTLMWYMVMWLYGHAVIRLMGSHHVSTRVQSCTDET
jgi:hypothetical protein